MIYMFIFVALLASFILYRYIAERYNIIDRPNERSSHIYLTVRGGGIVFPVAAVLWFLIFDLKPVWGISGLVLIAFISFLDDRFTIPGKVRMTVHFAAVTLLFIEFSFFSLSWHLWIPAYIVFIGWINAFNFMDGINGMTPLYSMVTLATFLYLSLEICFVPADLIYVITISVLIFSYFNVRRRAKAFAGDVGSVSMAFLLGGMMLSLMLKTGRWEYIMLFAVYAADSIFTIIHRLIKRENIFLAHRSHLYQYLSNELNIPHAVVSSIYSGIQLIINILSIWLFRKGLMDLPVFLIISLSVSACYFLARFYTLRFVSRRISA